MLMPRDVVTLFLRLNGWETLVVPTAVPPKVKLEGESVSGPIPTPLKVAVSGLLLALSTALIVPVADPKAVGLKDTIIVQNAFALSEAGQLLL
jgi:hypothetical protein